jgi:4-amino-4-deoxy-L-arabinose transferase-like glycosyltransferase
MAEGSAEARGIDPVSGPVEATRVGLRRLASIGIALVGAAVPFLIMCTELHFRMAVPIGFVSCLVSAWGILDAFGTFEGDDAGVVASTTLRALLPRIAELALSAIVLIALLTLAVAGVLPKPIPTAALLVPLAFTWMVAATFRVGLALGAFRESDGTAPPLLRRWGFWLVVLNVALYLPLLGSYSLSDPWETHYGEVSREMLARDDWISTWWAQDGWFWSKPVLDFWIQAMDFSLLGVKYLPGEMLRAAEHGAFPQPEWAARMPVFLLTVVSSYILYRAVRRVSGKRAGFLSSVVLTTMPYWYLIAHQTMTDMPYVSTLTAAMSFTFLGFVTDPERRLPLYEVRAGKKILRISALHLVLVAVILSTLPQILYLFSRDLTLYLRPHLHGFRPHWDEFFSGSGGGNCGLPGNQACESEHAVYPQPWFSPAVLAVLWTSCAGVFLWIERHERRVARVCFLGAWYFLALSMMGKGAPGLVLPVVSAFAFAGVTKRWRDLERVELAALVLLLACVGMPWYVQMYVRHGHPFIDRLIMHDMYARAFEHVHDTNQGDDVTFRYYVWQLGYGLFPWTGLAAGGLLFWLRRPDRTKDLQGDLATFMVVWFVATFGMFTITLTKFHHYILPLVPPTAVLTGMVVDRLLGAGSPAKPGALLKYLVASAAGLALVVLGIARLFPRRFLGEAIVGKPPWIGWAFVLMGLGVVLVLFSARRFGRSERAVASPSGRVRYDRTMVAVLAIASAIVVALVGRDLSANRLGSDGQLRLMNLFTYNYTRPWPDSLDFTGYLVGFSAVLCLLSLGLASERFRTQATALFCVACSLWTVFGLDIYLYKCAPHWGQRETVMAYYRDRTNANQPFVAYQMNWKGENFYTSNQVPAFVSSGERFKQWVDEQKAKGIHRIYFTSEHGRDGSLRRELGDPPSYKEITDKTLNNKFFVARVEY